MPALDYNHNQFLYSVSHTQDDIIMACTKASHYRLAVNGWVFFELFRDGKSWDTSRYTIKKIAMCYSNITGEAVGCAVAFEAWGDYNAGCFVRSELRRQGIGTRLIEDLLAGETTPVRIHDGITGSKDFWRFVGANDMDYIKDKCPVI